MRIDVVYARNIDHPFPVLAWAIMLFQKMSPFSKIAYNHMAFEYVDVNNKTKYLDATGTHGVKIKDPLEFGSTYKTIKKKRITLHTDPKTFDDWARSNVGIKYDRLQVVGLMIKNLFSFITFNTLGHNKKKVVCSELIVIALMKFNGLQVKDSDNYDLIETDKILQELD